MFGDRSNPSRRALIGRGAALLTFGVAMAGAVKASAAASTSKADVKYQFMPNGKAHCGLCQSFIPPSGGGSGAGTCKIVEGPIPQDGWCQLFSAK
jgi:hypothetical protein